MQLYLALSQSILKPVLNGQKGGVRVKSYMHFHWLKRKQVKIPVHGEEKEGESGGQTLFFSFFSVWICKGDLNEHYDGNAFPKQSFLFCLKAKARRSVWGLGLFSLLYFCPLKDSGV